MYFKSPGAPWVVGIQLSIDFVGSATAGDWIEAHVDPLRIGKRVAFLNGMVCKGSERVARTSAIFQLVF